MIWEEILELCQSSLSGDSQWEREKWRHLTQARRIMYAHLDLPETYKQRELPVVANQDYVEQPADLHSVKWIQNKDSGSKLRKEPNGTLGRSRFFVADTSKPPTGTMESVYFYVREAGKIWLRDTPNEAGTLVVEYKFVPAPLTAADLNKEDDLPSQYHMAMARVAIGSYRLFHPPMNKELGMPDEMAGSRMIQAALAEIEAQQEDPKAKENLDTRRSLYLRGYGMRM